MMSGIEPRFSARRDASSTHIEGSRVIVSIEAQRWRRGFRVTTLVEHVDATFRGLEPAMAIARERDAALVKLQRGLERQVAFLELLDDRLELGDGRLEILDGRIHV